MIGLTRTDGEHCRLHPDAVQRVEGHPTTVVHLTDGAKYAVLESVADVVRAVRNDRAAVMATAYRLIRGCGTGTVPDRAPSRQVGPHRPAAVPVREV
jgi:flagellar protein FlbD